MEEIQIQLSRVLAASIHLRSKDTITIICCYMPCGTSLADQSDYHSCLAVVSQVLSSSRGASIVLGDFNADVISKDRPKKTQLILRDFICQHSLVSLLALHCSRDPTTYCRTTEGTNPALTAFWCLHPSPTCIPTPSSSMMSPSRPMITVWY